MDEDIYSERTTTKSVQEKFKFEKSFNPLLSFLLASNAVPSTIGLIIQFLLLTIPVSMLVIGVRYQHRRFCPIEPRISLFLIVGGSVALGYFVLSIILSIVTIFLNYTRSFKTLIPVVVLAIITMLIHIFLFIWVIIGSVWTFSIHNQVEYTNPHRWKKYFANVLFMYLLLSI